MKSGSPKHEDSPYDCFNLKLSSFETLLGIKGVFEMKSAAVIAITFLTVSSLLAQVHIRESATIIPGQAKRVQISENKHKICFTFVWNTDCEGCTQTEIGRIHVYGPCGLDTTCEDTDRRPIMVINPARAGDYWFSLSLFKTTTDSSIGECSIYQDDSLIYEETRWSWATRNVVPNAWNYLHQGYNPEGDTLKYYSTPYYSTFQLQLVPTGFSYGQESGFFYGDESIVRLQGSDSCTNTAWSFDDPDPITFTILSGHRYASFHTFGPDGEDVKLDSTFTTTAMEIWMDQFFLAADSVRPDSAGEWVVVEAESKGVKSIDSIRIFPSPVVVGLVPSEISPGDTAMIVVKNQNPDGTITDFTPDQFFEVGIDSGNAYGTILSQGDTAQYFARRPQPLQFIAVDSISADSEIVGIRVGWEQEVPCSTVPGVKENSGQNRKAGGTTVDANLKNTAINPPARKVNILPVHRKSVSDAPNFSSGYYGIGWVEIEKTKITINIPTPKQEWPNLPPHSGGNPNARDEKKFTVTVTRGGKPLPNYGVTTTASMILPSGGHAHLNQPPQAEMGELEDYVHHVDGNGTITTLTDGDGNIFIDFTAPEFSGNVLMTASSTTENVSAHDTISVMVPGFVNFRDLIFLPNRARPYAFQQTTQTAIDNHPDNNWCTPEAGDQFFLGILDFYFLSGSADGGGTYLSINDMSLPWGGLFDALYSNWQPPHSAHRIGLSIDINPNDANDIPLTLDQIRQLNFWMAKHQCYRNSERQIHYGYLNGRN
ncbi:MAG TPA: hypothetical protein VLX91_11470 [Candidatus Acidoferrales bacterium]|nr:hypothetical protein [Candidatus Acidoferrales bacterium]